MDDDADLDAQMAAILAKKAANKQAAAGMGELKGLLEQLLAGQQRMEYLSYTPLRFGSGQGGASPA